jgi:poly(A) polymerase
MNAHPTWLDEPALQTLFAATAAAGGQARVVGGAVRDFLMDREGGDVDVASSLTPEKTMEIAAAQGWKAVPTGIAHGTVTLVLPQRIVEVTTLRRDVQTDGRHALVAFTERFEEDAARRDFTFNALYMDAAGALSDFFGGREDLQAQCVKFIGDAATRITEDGLRMLRYFRFLATHGKPPADAEALAAIAEKKAMVAQLSGERVAAEMRKLLTADNPAYALRLMAETGVAPLVFGRDITPTALIRLHMLEVQAGYQCSVWARALLLLPQATQADATWLEQRWKLSRHEAAQLQLLAALPAFDAAAPRYVHTRLIRLHGAPAYLDWLLAAAVKQAGLNVAEYVQLAHDFVPPNFPVTAKDLVARGMAEGKALGDRLRLLEEQWEISDYTLSKEALLAQM